MSKNALVTGGTRGIGKAISVGLKNAGYNVVANYAGNEEAAAQFTEETGITAIKWDVADYAICETAIGDIEARHGATDILVNNAGVTRDIPFHKMSLDHWRTVMSIDLDSAFNMTRPVINGMRDRGFGRIVNISSINGQKGQFGQANYSAAKAGLIGFTRALAQETARKGITVNAVAPGYIGTDMVNALDDKVLDSIVGQIPVGRLGTPEEIADCVNFLVSEQCGFITGSVLTANGGQYIAA
ncbi:acetoacetyl-CoA reductase [Parvularcula sp. IMCC14364]|uniref:acetoacetyl-CoA reductase n=1 Tax=Parvularcula sp. IMCC14364 TaxID=3067902 RepID=UPI0027406ECB|nr:acetoacetyl-CoA reductase [Parvularcula sp. IMCC14364]